MQYVGSKNRIAKELTPIIQNYINENNIKTYIEPFVGGANIIDKIKCDNKIGCDIHEELIELLKYVQTNYDKMPLDISQEEYFSVKNNKNNYPKWYVALVGFCGSYGAKYFGGYVGNYKKDNKSRSNEAIRNLLKQAPCLQDIKFQHLDFQNIHPMEYKNCLFYCDIPYKGTTKYKTNIFPYDKFYEWAKLISKNNIILISEYEMPKDFKCIYQKEHFTTLEKCDNKKIRIEKLFTL